MVWGTRFPPQPAAEAVATIGDGSEGPARTTTGRPNVTGPLEDASGRNAWLVEGHDTNDNVVLRWRPVCNAPPDQWHDPCLSVDHKTDDTGDCQIVVRIYDTDGNLVHTAAVTESLTWATQEISPSDGTILAGVWTVGERFTVEVDVTLDGGVLAWVECPLYPPLGA